MQSPRLPRCSVLKSALVGAVAFGLLGQASVCGQTLFDNVRVDYDLPSEPADSVCADFTGDGFLDLVVTLPNSSRVALLINRGDGVFLPPLLTTVTLSPRGCAAGDIDGDGDLDVVAALSGGSAVRLLLNDGSGNLSLGGTVATSNAPFAVTLGHLNADANIDMVTASSVGLQTFLGNGAGGFAGGANTFLTGTVTELETRDLNANGFQDVVGLRVGAGTALFILHGNGDGTFASPEFSSTGSNPRRLDIVNFAGSPHPDIVVANGDSANLSLHVNNGAGQFPSTSFLAVMTGPQGVRGLDLDGDGDTDFVVSAFNGFLSRVYLSDGAGGFTPGATRHLPGGGTIVEVADFDSDGTHDALIGTQTGVSSFRGNGSGGFHAPPTLNESGPVRGIASADMNGDGFKDLVEAVEFSGGILRVRLNDGMGGFNSASDHAVGWTAKDVAVGDFDGDDDVDVAFSADGPGGLVRVYLNNGDGSLAAPVTYTPGSGSDQVEVIDVDGDLDLDLAVTCSAANHVRLLINSSTGAFSLGAAIPVGASPQGLAAGDIDGDGDPDLVATCSATDQYARLLNNGSGAFSVALFPTGDGPANPVLADLDGDDLPDLIVPLSNDSFTRVHKNSGGGAFAVPQSLNTGLASEFAAVGDLDGNGTPDIAVTARDGTRVSVVNNLGAMILINYADYDAGFGPGPVVITDLDGNGSNDMAVGHSYSAQTLILSNSTPTVVSAQVAGERRILVEFSEPVQNGDLLPTNYALSGTAKGTLNTFPDQVWLDGPKTRTLSWDSGEMFHGGDATISVTGFLRDERMNQLGFTKSRTDVGGGLGVAPNAAFSTDFGSGIIEPLFQVDLDFSELVTGFNDGDIEITNGQILGSIGAGGSHTYDISALAEGTVTLTIPADAYTDLAGNAPNGDATISITYDATAPVLSISTVDPTRVGPDPVSIDFTALDSGVGLGTVQVWARKKGLVDYDLVGDAVGASGVIEFNSVEEGVYELAIVGEDQLGNGGAVPDEPSLTVVYNADAGSFTHIAMSPGSYPYPMTNDLDVLLTISGSPFLQPTIGINRIVGDGAPAGLNSARLIDERLDIQGSLNGAFGTIEWPFDPANAAGLVGPIDTVFQVEAGVVIGQFPATVVGNTITFGPVNSFSEWWAGNDQSAVGGWESFD